MIASVYHTPLPAVFDMSLGAIAYYLGIMGKVVEHTNPMAAKPEKPMTPEQVRSLLA